MEVSSQLKNPAILPPVPEKDGIWPNAYNFITNLLIK